MADIQRLTRLAERGDRSAAAELHRHAVKTQDDALLRKAAGAMGSPQAAAEAATALWQADDATALADYARSWGLVIDETQRRFVQCLLDEINGDRRVRLLDATAVLAALFEARHTSEPFVYVTGGLRKSGMHSPRTSACLVVPAERDGRQVLVLGLVEASSTAHEPPRAWPEELRPWRKDMSKNLERLAAWAAAADRNDRQLFELCEPTVEAAPEIVEPDVPVELTPTQTLDALLTGEPSEAAFRELTSLLDKWPAKKGKAPDALTRDEALARAVSALESWPDETRVVTRRTLSRILKGKSHKLADPLYRHARLKDAPDDEIVALAGGEATEQLTLLTLLCESRACGEVAAAALADSEHVGSVHTLAFGVYRGVKVLLATLLGSDRFTSLRRIDLRPAQQLEMPVATDPRLLAGVETLDLLGEDRYYGPRFSKEAAVAMFSSPHVASLREIAMSADYTSSNGAIVHAIGSSPHLGALRVARLPYFGAVDAEALGALGTKPLEVLELDDTIVDVDALRALLEGVAATTLRTLRLGSPHCCDRFCELVAGAQRLETLALTATPFPYYYRDKKTPPPIGPEGAALLAAAPWTPRLRWLELGSSAPTADGLRRILDRLEPGHLEVLDLRAASLDAEAARVIGECAALTGLRRLDLSNNPIGDEGFAAIATSPHLTSLRELDAGGCAIGTAGAAALATSQALPALRWLELRSNALGNEGARELSRSPALQRVERIGLHQSGIGKDGIAFLASSRWLEGRFDGLPGYAME